MDQENRQANVVLTADTSGYTQSVNQAAQSTGDLNKQVDGLLGKLGNLSRTAGNRLMLFSAADVASLTAATVAYASFEHQMNGLNAQAAILDKTVKGNQQTFKAYASEVDTLRTKFPTTTAAAAQLVMTLSKFQQFTGPGTAGINKLADTFMKAQGATGESASAIAQSVLQLQQLMGTTSADTGKFTDQIVTLAARSQTSATALADFASQLAPIGKVAGATQTQVVGIATAFARAGQDGTYAASAFNKFLSDVTGAIASGSPDLAKYSALLGMTTDQFTKMGATEGVIRLFEQINRMGPDAITTLNQFGLDGARTLRAITAVSNQQGGLSGAIGEAQKAYANGGMQAGSDEGFSGLSNSLTKLEEQFKMFGESIGKNVTPVVTGVVNVIDDLMSSINKFLSGPGGKFIAWGLAAAASLAGVAGMALHFAPMLLAAAGINSVIRGSGMYGLRAGLTGQTPFGAEKLAAGEGRAAANLMYSGGSRVGGAVRSGYQATQAAFEERFGGKAMSETAAKMSWMVGMRELPGAPSRMSYLAGLPLRGAAVGMDTVSAMLSPLGYGARGGAPTGFQANIQNRLGELGIPMMGQSGLGGAIDPTERATLFQKARFKDYWQAAKDQGQGMKAALAAYGSKGDAEKASGILTAGKTEADLARDAQAAKIAETKAAQAAGKSLMGVEAAAGKTGGAMKGMITALVAATATIGRETGLLAAKGAGMAMMGGLKAGGAAMLENPLMLAMMGMMVVPPIIDHFKDNTSGTQAPLTSLAQAYGAAAGQAPTISLSKTAQTTAQAPVMAQDLSQLTDITPNEQAYATSADYVYNNDQIKQYSQDDAGYADFQRSIAATMASAGGMDPAGMNKIVNDTMKYFGKEKGQQMANFLAKGNFKVDYTGIFASMYGKNNEQAQVLGQALSNAIGQGQSASSAVSAMQGTEASFQGLAGIFTGLAGSGGSRQIDQATQALKDKLGLSVDVSQAMQLSMTSDSAKQMGVASQGRSGVYAASAIKADTRTDAEKGQAALAAAIGSDDDLRNAMLDKFGSVLNDDMSPQEMAAAVYGNQGDFGDIYKSVSSTTMRLLRAAGNLPANLIPLFGSDQVASAYTSGNPSEVFQAGMNIYNSLRYKQDPDTLGLMPGMSNARIVGVAQAMMSSGFTQDDPRYQIGLVAQQQAQQNLAATQPYVTRGVYAARVGEQLIQQQTNINPVTDASGQAAQELKDVQTGFQTWKQQQYSFYQSIAVAQQQFDWQKLRAEQDFGIQRDRMEQQYDLSRERAQEDYHRQRMYEEQDYQLARNRAEFDYGLQTSRAQADFAKQQRRATQDFYLDRRRQEEDFNHQVTVMTETAAKNMYDIYQRVTVQRTISATTLLTNAKDQLGAMRTQESQLDKLRQMGLSDKAIQQLGLTDPKNAQQLARFYQDILNDPSLIKKFNDQMRARIKAAGGLVTDQSSMDWKEFSRQYSLARDRGLEDFQRAMRRARVDFAQQMDRADDDFRRSLARQAEDHATMMSRQADQFKITLDRQEQDYNIAISNMVDDFNKQLERGQQDINRMATQLVSSFPQMINTVLKSLRGKNREEALAILAEFRDLKEKIGTSADSVNAMLQSKWGITLKNDPGLGTGGKPGDNNGGDPPPDHNPNHLVGTGGGAAPKGAFPTQTKGKAPDSSDGMTIFFPLPKGTYSYGTPFGEKGDMWESGYHTGQDFPAATGTPISAVMAGWAEHAGWGGNEGGQGSAYGNETLLFHGRNPQDQTVETLYGHQSAINIHKGENVEGGQHIGDVGETGNTTGPHLHLELRLDGNPVDPLSLFGMGTIHLTEGETSAPPFDKKKFLDKIWPKVEEAAGKIGVGGGIEYGDMSRRMNRVAFHRLQQMASGNGFDSVAEYLGGQGSVNGDFGTGRPGSLKMPANTSEEANKKLARQMMLQYHPGWEGMWPALLKLWMQESGFNEQAKNSSSGAYGIPQSLPADKMATSGADYLTNPATQIDWGLKYIKERYGDPRVAWEHEVTEGWYQKGGLFKSPSQIGVGEHGPEMVLPLNRSGAEFIHSLLALESRNLPGNSARPMACSHNTYNQQLDHRTQYLGDIAVQAQDPNEFITKMKMRQRAENMIQPALATR